MSRGAPLAPASVLSVLLRAACTYQHFRRLQPARVARRAVERPEAEVEHVQGELAEDPLNPRDALAVEALEETGGGLMFGDDARRDAPADVQAVVRQRLERQVPGLRPVERDKQVHRLHRAL